MIDPTLDKVNYPIAKLMFFSCIYGYPLDDGSKEPKHRMKVELRTKYK
jgi:hypothetical protein